MPSQNNRKPARKARRKQQPGRQMSTLVNTNAPFPDRFITRLKYSDRINLTYGGSSTPAYHTWRLNSVFDPNYTGIGHQPLGHDEYAALYNKYRVVACSYTITMVNRSTTVHAECAIAARPNTVNFNNMETIRESASCLHKFTLGVEGSGQAIKVVKGYVSIAQLRGITKTHLESENDYAAAMLANPVIQPTMQIYFYSTDFVSSVVVDQRVDLTYHVEFYDRKLLVQS